MKVQSICLEESRMQEIVTILLFPDRMTSISNHAKEVTPLAATKATPVLVVPLVLEPTVHPQGLHTIPARVL